MGDALYKRLLSFVESKEEFNQNDLKNHFKEDKKKLLPFLQKLVHSQRLKIMKDRDGSIYWQVQSQEHSRKFSGLQGEHMLVLQEINNSGSKGLWVRTIKSRTKLPTVAINKILQQLESRQLVKSLKSIAAKKQKLYVGFDVVPDSEHTGGVWYNSEGDFDEEFVQLICKWSVAMIRQHGSLSIKELCQQLKKSAISKVALTEKDLQRIVLKLRLENEIEQYFDPDGTKDLSTDENHKRWKVVSKISTHQYLATTPCGICPVVQQCCDGGKISPKTCVYMDSWLGSSNMMF